MVHERVSLINRLVLGRFSVLAAVVELGHLWQKEVDDHLRALHVRERRLDQRSLVTILPVRASGDEKKANQSWFGNSRNSLGNALTTENLPLDQKHEFAG